MGVCKPVCAVDLLDVQAAQRGQRSAAQSRDARPGSTSLG